MGTRVYCSTFAHACTRGWQSWDGAHGHSERKGGSALERFLQEHSADVPATKDRKAEKVHAVFYRFWGLVCPAWGHFWSSLLRLVGQYAIWIILTSCLSLYVGFQLHGIFV